MAQGVLNYELYSFDQSIVQWDSHERAGTAENFPRFFDESEPGVTFVQSGKYEGPVYFLDGSEPSYLAGEYLAWKLEGYLYVPATDDYTFTFGCDDTGDVVIDGNVIVSHYANWTRYGGLGDQDDSKTINLTEGYHSVMVRLVQNEDNIGIGLAWKSVTDLNSAQVIPQEYFYDSIEEEVPDFDAVISGTVKKGGKAVARQVMAHRRDTGVLVNSAVSNADGSYEIPVYSGVNYYVIVLDDEATAQANDEPFVNANGMDNLGV